MCQGSRQVLVKCLWKHSLQHGGQDILIFFFPLRWVTYWIFMETSEADRLAITSTDDRDNETEPQIRGLPKWWWKVSDSAGCCSVAKSYLTLRPHGLQHTKFPCPSLSPRVCSNSCPLSWWWYKAVSSSAAFFSFCLQSFPALRSFPMSQLFTSDSQSTGGSTWLSFYLIVDKHHPGC